MTNITVSRKPLPPGTVIGFMGQVATVVEDTGGNTIRVIHDGADVFWYWTIHTKSGGEKSCHIVSLPPVTKPAPTVPKKEAAVPKPASPVPKSAPTVPKPAPEQPVEVTPTLHDEEYKAQLREHIMKVRDKLISTDVCANDAKGLLLLNLLLKFWDGDRRITQPEIAHEIPKLGYHEIWEAKLSCKKEIDSTCRKVRQIIRDVLRVKYHLPVLSTSGKGKAEGKDAGYWFARNREESRDYLIARKKEIEAVYKSSLQSLKAMQAALAETEFDA